MPVTTPSLKVDAVRTLSGEVVLHGDSYSDAYQHALKLAKQHKYTFVHPFDDPDVIAGQGTIGMEILRQHQHPIHAVFVAMGGGGLISGVAAYIKAVRPEIKVVGVQMADSDAMVRSVRAGKRIKLDDVGLFSDATAVKLVGEETFRMTRALVDDFIVVDTDAVCAGIKDVFEDTRSIMEPAGAMGVAAIKQYVARHHLKDQALVAITCGANMNFDRLRFVAERAEVGEEREALFAVTHPGKAGQLQAALRARGRPQRDRVQLPDLGQEGSPCFRGSGHDPPWRSGKDRPGVRRARLRRRSTWWATSCRRSTCATWSAAEARWLATSGCIDSSSPSGPGRSMRFLTSMHPNWNISLFHYRNQGADYGRILIGIQVPAGEKAAFQQFVDTLGYPYVDETENPAYHLFLR